MGPSWLGINKIKNKSESVLSWSFVISHRPVTKGQSCRDPCRRRVNLLRGLLTHRSSSAAFTISRLGSMKAGRHAEVAHYMWLSATPILPIILQAVLLLKIPTPHTEGHINVHSVCGKTRWSDSMHSIKISYNMPKNSRARWEHFWLCRDWQVAVSRLTSLWWLSETDFKITVWYGLTIGRFTEACVNVDLINAPVAQNGGTDLNKGAGAGIPFFMRDEAFVWHCHRFPGNTVIHGSGFFKQTY